MTPGFWLVVGLVVVCLVAPFLIWVGDRIADALDALDKRHAAQDEADAATYGEPTRAQIEKDWT